MFLRDSSEGCIWNFHQLTKRGMDTVNNVLTITTIRYIQAPAVRLTLINIMADRVSEQENVNLKTWYIFS